MALGIVNLVLAGVAIGVGTLGQPPETPSGFAKSGSRPPDSDTDPRCRRSTASTPVPQGSQPAATPTPRRDPDAERDGEPYPDAGRERPGHGRGPDADAHRFHRPRSLGDPDTGRPRWSGNAAAADRSEANADAHGHPDGHAGHPDGHAGHPDGHARPRRRRRP